MTLRLIISLCLCTLTVAAKPNIIFILIDDMSWSGTSVQLDPNLPQSKGSHFQTPQLEKLAKEGMRFTQAYAPGAMCTPSRAGILTGKTPAEVRMTTPGGGRTQNYHKLSSGQKDRSLSTELDTIAKSLKLAGYATAHLGKWHLGNTGPAEYGYDLHDGNTSNNVPNSRPDNPKDIFDINARAFAFMEQQSTARKPFYLQISHYAVHSPVEARESSKELFKDVPSIGKNNAATHAAMTYDVDDSIGLIRAKVKALGLSKNTYLVVMSDNGGNSGGGRKGTTGALSAGKGSLLEGGIRVPFFAEGPGIRGGTISRQSITGCDLYPTFCQWAGIQAPKGLAGKSLAAIVSGKITRLDQRPLVFHNPHYGKGPRQKPQSALILGDYKVLYNWEGQTTHLYNLTKDPGESDDLARKLPEKATEMLTLLKQELAAVDASLPAPNPTYDPNAEAPSRRKNR